MVNIVPFSDGIKIHDSSSLNANLVVKMPAKDGVA